MVFAMVLDWAGLDRGRVAFRSFDVLAFEPFLKPGIRRDRVLDFGLVHPSYLVAGLDGCILGFKSKGNARSVARYGDRLCSMGLSGQ
jgi:hypothetical protein